jgi:aspartyl aminopeptidase
MAGEKMQEDSGSTVPGPKLAEMHYASALKAAFRNQNPCGSTLGHTRDVELVSHSADMGKGALRKRLLIPSEIQQMYQHLPQALPKKR